MGQEPRAIQGDLDLKRKEGRQVQGPVALPELASITKSAEQDQASDGGGESEEAGEEPRLADITEEVEQGVAGIGSGIAEVGYIEDLEPTGRSVVPDHREPADRSDRSDDHDVAESPTAPARQSSRECDVGTGQQHGVDDDDLFEGCSNSE